MESECVHALSVLGPGPHLLEEACRRPVARELSIVPVEVADAVGRVPIGAPAKVLHHGLLARSVCFGLHHLLLGQDGVLAVPDCSCRATKAEKSYSLKPHSTAK